MEPSSPAHVLVVAHKTAATPALLEAVRERAARGSAWFHLLIPNPHPAGWRPSEAAHSDVTDGEQILALAVPLIEVPVTTVIAHEGARTNVAGPVSGAQRRMPVCPIE
jgi:hypothetical protein